MTVTLVFQQYSVKAHGSNTREALSSFDASLRAVHAQVTPTERIDAIVHVLRDVERYISDNRAQRDQVSGVATTLPNGPGPVTPVWLPC